MADDLKKVGLVFKADGSTDFQKSLTSINNSLQNNRNEFKLTKMSYDENTKASTKLKDTQSYLSKQYDESTKKVELLTSQLDEMKNSENANEQAIQKKEKQLISAKIQQESYRKGLEEVSESIKKGTADLEEFAKKTQETGSKISSVGTKITAGITAPILAIATASSVAWSELDEAYDNIVAGTGATGDALAELQATFDVVFGSMAVEAGDASTAIADLNTRFGFTNEELAEASQSFLKFAAVNNTDVSTAIALVSRAMGDAGIEASEYATLLDSLTTASQASGLSIDKLTENLTKYGAPMRQLGFDTNSTIALFSQWEKAGVNTEIAFSGMKKAISNWSSAGKDSRVEFKKTLKEIEKCPTLAKATTKAIEVFGAKAGPDLADAIKNGRFSVEEMTAAMEDSANRVNQSYDDMLDPVDNAKIAINNLKLVGSELGSEIQGTLAPILEDICVVLQNFSKWFKNLNPHIKTAIVVVAGLAAAIGPLIVVIGTVVSSFGAITKALLPIIAKVNTAGGLFSALSSSISTVIAPVTAVIAIITLLIATFVDLWNTSAAFRSSIVTMWKNISSVISNVYNTILKPVFIMLEQSLMDIWNDSLKPLWENWKLFVNNIIWLMQSIVTAITPVLNWFISTFRPLFSGIFSGAVLSVRTSIAIITEVLRGLLTSCNSIVSGIRNIISGIVTFISGVFTGNWKKAWKGVVSIFKGIVSTLVGVFKAPMNGVIGIMNGVISGINTMIKGINKISFDIPSWVPGLGGKKLGFNLKTLSKINYMQFGGELLNGVSIVGEAGAEMLQQTSRGTRVIPLTDSGGTNKQDIIDYDRLAEIFINALQTLDSKIVLDHREIGRLNYGK